jgi:hypothetical protein
MLLVLMTRAEINVLDDRGREEAARRAEIDFTCSGLSISGLFVRDTRSQRIGRPEKLVVTKARERASPYAMSQSPRRDTGTL